ncbi:DNA ligase [bacterium]|nr:DNA ligase [bacterium]
MADLEDGQNTQVRGSSGSLYELRNVGGAYSCSCPAWRNQSHPAHQRTCKHLTQFRGAEVEKDRLQSAGATPAMPRPPGAAPAAGPPILLAHSWDQLTDLSGWWMSEKLDGVRAYWDGTKLISRLGNTFVAPDWFLEGLPDHPLDGELWGGRKLFQRTVSIVRRQDAGKEWQQIQFVVFDAPALTRPFESRQQQCRDWLAGAPARFSVLSQELCQGLEHLRGELARVEGQGGEGLMLRQPGSHYESGRSWTLLKIKSFHDSEATVIGHQPGEGRHQGRLGALLLELPNGTRFSVGTGFSDAERSDPPPLGSVVTFRYQELSDAGVPRFPSWVGRRFDAVQPAAKTPRPRPEPAPASIGEDIRRFEYTDGASQKFWEVAVSDAQHTVRFGRLGTAGQSKSKTFAGPAEARRDAAKLVSEKLDKGYREITSAS